MIKIGGAKFEIDARKLRKDMLKMRRQILGKTVMVGIAEEGLTLIQQRTQKGRSLTGSIFKKYSKSYARYKKKKGRKISPPDLTFTGRMLGAMQSKFVRPGKSVIQFSRSEEAIKAIANEGMGREFFGIAKREEKMLIKEANRLIDKETKRLGLT